MVEYGQGVGQVSGQAGGAGAGGTSTDVGADVMHFVNDTADQIAALPPEMLLLIGVLLIVGLIVLRRAF